MWTRLVEKIDLEKEPRKFLKDIGKIEGRKEKDRVETIRNENGVFLKSKELLDLAFRRRLTKTFNISEEENDPFCEEMEVEVESLIRNNQERLVKRRNVESVDTPEITPELVKCIIKRRTVSITIGHNKKFAFELAL